MNLNTGREDLVALDASLAGALAAGDVETAEALSGAALPRPFALPPLLDEDIAAFAEALRRTPDERGWWGWLVTADRQVVGFVICSRPSDEGVSMIGWSTYPHACGRGHASRAAARVMEWALATGAVRCVRATIPPALESSIRVARRIGLSEAGSQVVGEIGVVRVFERRANAIPTVF